MIKWGAASLLAALTCARAQAPWPQSNGDSLHTRRSAAAWPRPGNASAAAATLLSGIPLATPLLIGSGGVLYAGAADGLVYALSPAGATLWTLPGLATSALFALSDGGTRLFAHEASSGGLAIYDISGAAPRPLPAPLSLGGLVWLRGDLLLQANFVLRTAVVAAWDASSSTLAWVSQVTVSDACMPYAVQGVVGPAALYLVPLCQYQGPYLEEYLEANVTAFDVASGRELWASSLVPLAIPQYFAPLLLATADFLVIGRGTVLGELYLTAHDARSGALLWAKPAAPSATSVNVVQAGFAVDAASLLSYNLRVLLASGEVQALPIPSLASLPGRVALLDASGALFYTYAAPAGTVDVYAFDAGTGARLMRDDPLTVPGTGGNLAMDGEGNLYLGALGAGVYALSAAPRTATPQSSASPSASPGATPSAGLLSPSQSAAPAPPPASASAPPPPAPAPSAPRSALAPAAWGAIGASLGALGVLGAACLLPAARGALLSAWGAGAQRRRPAGEEALLGSSVNRAAAAYAAD